LDSVIVKCAIIYVRSSLLIILFGSLCLLIFYRKGMLKTSTMILNLFQHCYILCFVAYVWYIVLLANTPREIQLLIFSSPLCRPPLPGILIHLVLNYFCISLISFKIMTFFSNYNQQEHCSSVNYNCPEVEISTLVLMVESLDAFTITFQHK
jgi:hypothetical protein